MKYREISRFGIKLSQLTVGTWAAGGQGYGKVDRKEVIEAIKTMIRKGVNVVDTAPVYGDGASEILVGEALKDIRDQVFLCTKFGTYNNEPDDPRGGIDNRYANCMEEIRASLDRLQTDHIDLYFIHWPDPLTPVQETMEALNVLKAQGKIRYVGVSNFSREQIEEAEKFGQIDAVQSSFSMADQTEREFLQWAAEKGFYTMTYGSLGAGILTGAVRTLPEFEEGDMRKVFYDFYREPKFSQIMRLLEEMDRIAAKYKKPLAQLAINWSSRKPFVDTCMAGIRNTKEAEENCAAFEWTLGEEDIRKLDRKMKELGLD